MKSRLLLLIAISLAAALPLFAADWPQWEGPDRTNISKETGLLKSWPANGPKLLWTFDKAGVGFSGPAVVGDRLYTMGARDGKEMIFALDVKTGQELWATEFTTQWKNGYGDGPRGTPTVDGDFVYGIGGDSEIVCVDASKKGEKVWSKSMKKDLNGEHQSGWGYSESPYIDGDRIICTPGGKDGTFAALDKKTGNVIWRSKEVKDPSGYSSIIAIEVNKIRQFVHMSPSHVLGVAADDGKVLWSYAKDSKTAAIPTPVFSDGQVYVTSGYGVGCDLIKLSAEASGGTFKADKVWANKNLSNHHGGVVLVDGHIYGYTDGRGWVCQDFKTGMNVWEEKGKLGKGSLTCAEGLLYCYAERDGTLVLADASPSGWKEHGRFKIPRETGLPRQRGQIWTHPVIANGKLYLRDQDLIFCYDIKAK